MKLLRSFLDKNARHFEKGGKLHRLHPLWEATDTFLYTPGRVTTAASHVRDGIDLKRLMSIVVIALAPCMLMAMYNTGYQAHLAIEAGTAPLANWQTAAFTALGFDLGSKGSPLSQNILACFVHGALYFIPVYLVTIIVGGLFETLFAMVRRHEINEGFLVTSALYPLTLPPNVPLWQVALGIAFGVVFGKEVFGGTGRNIWNPALTGRIFLYFAYPAQLSGDAVWIAAQTSPDVYSGATWLAIVREHGVKAFLEGVPGLSNGALSFWDAFLGLKAGSFGETSILCCIIGAAVLVGTGVGSWRIMAGSCIGSFALIGAFNLIGGSSNPMLGIPFYWHWVIGSFAFATVFMATDPVSAPYTNTGRWIYGALIGAFGMLIRCVNPAFPESWMLAIIFMNIFSSIIDHFVVQANIKRRMARYEA
jgi:Na+-transporting NADH:ubiquinone oxidoreductase subunit B